MKHSDTHPYPFTEHLSTKELISYDLGDGTHTAYRQTKTFSLAEQVVLETQLDVYSWDDDADKTPKLRISKKKHALPNSWNLYDKNIPRCEESIVLDYDQLMFLKSILEQIGTP